MSREAKLDLNSILESAKDAHERIKQFPSWEQDAIRLVSFAAASIESREVLYKSRKDSEND
jgi:hypothetical protein